MNLSRDSDYFLELQTHTGWGQILASFARWCSPQPGQRILDVGTGPGFLPALFSRHGARAVGIDLDPAMFTGPLHHNLAIASAETLPFAANTFEIVTASNLLFLANAPLQLLAEICRVSSAKVCLLNPSERMSVQAASALADAHHLTGLARETLLNLARRAESHVHWSQADLERLFSRAGMELTATATRMGPGLIRYACGQKIVV